MKKIICVILIGIVGLISCFAEGVSDSDQSYSLLVKQKCLKNYKDSPETATFYECYIMRTDDIENDKCTLALLDIFEKKGNFLQNIIVKPSIFINPATSKEMGCTSGASFLKEKNTVYKCVVLFSVQIYGYAVVNLFEAKPVTDRILIVWPTQENESLLSFNNWNDKSSNELLVCYEKNRGKVLVIDHWPDPTTFKEYSIRDLQKERGDTIIPSQLSEKDIQMFIDSMVDFGFRFETTNKRFVSITVYNKNNNEIYFKDTIGREKWYEYDESGNMIHSKDQSGYEEWCEYDKNGNRTHYKNTSGGEELHEYDKNGNMIYFKNTKGDEEWYEYDKNDNMIHSKYSFRFIGYGELWYEYDKNGNRIHCKGTSGGEEWYEYDKNGNMIHYESTYSYYDKNGNIIHIEDLEEEEWYEYDENGNMTNYKNKSGYEEWYKYDKNSNEIYFKNTKGNEEWYEYEFWDNSKIKKMYIYANHWEPSYLGSKKKAVNTFFGALEPYYK